VGNLLPIRPAHDKVILSSGFPQLGSDVGSVYELKTKCYMSPSSSSPLMSSTENITERAFGTPMSSFSLWASH